MIAKEKRETKQRSRESTEHEKEYRKLCNAVRKAAGKDKEDWLQEQFSCSVDSCLLCFIYFFSFAICNVDVLIHGLFGLQAISRTSFTAFCIAFFNCHTLSSSFSDFASSLSPFSTWSLNAFVPLNCPVAQCRFVVLVSVVLVFFSDAV